MSSSMTHSALVHAREIRFRRARFPAAAPESLPGLLQQREFVFDVRDLGGIAHARGLDAQDGDLVEQLAGRNGNQDVFHP